MDAVVYPVAVSVIVGAVMWAAGRFSLKSKVQVQVDKHEEEICKIKDSLPLVVEGVHTLLIAAKEEGKINGNSDDLMKRFDDHIYDRKK